MTVEGAGRGERSPGVVAAEPALTDRSVVRGGAQGWPVARPGAWLGCALLAGVSLSCAASGTSGGSNVAGENGAAKTAERPEKASGPGAAERALPRLHVTPGRVLLDGERVAENTATTPRRIDELTAAIRALRGAAEAAGSNDEALASYRLAADDEVSAAELKSAFQTAAFAGWRRAEVNVEGAAVVLDAFVPIVGDDRAYEVTWPERALVLVVRESGVEVWRAGFGAPSVPQGEPGQGGGLGLTGVPPEETGEKAGEAPVQRAQVAKDRLEEDLPEVLAAECGAGPCSPALLFAEDAARFALLRNALTGLARATGAGDAPLVQLRVGEFTPDRSLTRTIRVAGGTVSGRLPPEVIQKVIREQSHLLRACYVAGLEREPELTGRVVTRFVINREGAVSAAGVDDTSTLEDQEVRSCVTRVFLGLVFPKPEGGVVSVVYPIQFSPE